MDEREKPVHVADSLARNIDKMDEKNGNFVIITLGKIVAKTQLTNLSKLSSKLLDDSVVIGKGGDITFEKRSKDNLTSSSISSITGKIFVNSLQKGIKITEISLNHLVSALESNDKQTPSLSAKALSLAASNDLISESVLMDIRDYVDDGIADVAIYTTLAYTGGLNKLVQNQGLIQASHIEFLSKVYAFENLKLGEKDFTKEVNSNILSVLLHEANKEEFEESVFIIFDYILFNDEDNQRKVIEMLHIYTTRYPIPTNTIAALENALGIPEVRDLALKNVIQKGQVVNERNLRMFADNLYLEIDESMLFKSFVLMDIANDNQDLSDELLDILELQGAEFVNDSCTKQLYNIR